MLPAVRMRFDPTLLLRTARVGLLCGLLLCPLAAQAVGEPGGSEFDDSAFGGSEFGDSEPSSSEPGDSAGNSERADSAHARWSFRRTQAPSGAGPLGITAIAVRGGLVALGDEDGVQLSVSGGPYTRVVRSGRVQDLEFGPDGALWVSAADGLFRLAPDGRVVRESPGAGEVARLATRVRIQPPLFAVATAGGLFLSVDGRSWSPRVGALPNAAVTGLALRPLATSIDSPTRVEVWALAGGFPWRLRVHVEGERVTVDEAERVTFSGRPSGVAPVDVALDVPGAEVVLVYPGSLATHTGAAGWRVLRPVLPPGAEIRRLVRAAGSLWLLTTRGLLNAASLDASFRRTGSPAGTTPAWGLASQGEGVLVASEQGLLAGQPRRRLASMEPASVEATAIEATAMPVADPVAPALTAHDPDIQAVHAAALHYLGLGPERFRELREGLDRRGWLPLLSLRFDYAVDRDDRHDWDQSYVSGDRRDLYDYERARARDLGGSVLLTWDLGDTLYNPDAIELSREARQRISLRDDAIDEINQLYFERRSVMIALAAQPPDADPLEVARLRLRASELAAGLDGWTGGWFSRASLARAR